MTTMVDEDLLDDRTVVSTDGPRSIEDSYDTDRQPPLALIECFGERTRRRLIDYFCTSNVPERGQNLSQIADNADVSRNSVASHVDVLCQFGLLLTHGEGSIQRYTLNDEASLAGHIHECNELLADEWERNIGETVEGRGGFRRCDTDAAPLCINELCGSKVRRAMLDYVLTGSFPDEGLNQSALGDRADVSRNSVMRHIGLFEGLTLVEDTGASGIRQYRPTDNEIQESLVELNEALTASFDN